MDADENRRFPIMSDGITEYYKCKIDNISENIEKLNDIVVLGTEDKDSLLSRVKLLENNIAEIIEIKIIVNNICEKVTSLEKEDKNSRSKIMILLIVLALSYLESLIPKIVTILENIVKYL